MDLSIFKNSPEVAPLLIRLYDSHKLHSLLKEDAPLARAEVLNAVTDLLDAELSVREEELLTDVLVGLFRQAERDLRHALADRLSVMDNVPLRLVLHLANDEIEIAKPVLQKSPVLSDMDLIYIIKGKGPDYWQAIAHRTNLSDQVIDILAEKRDVETAIVLTQNDRVTLTRHALDILAEMSAESDELARPLVLRKDMPQDLVRSMYHYVNENIQTLIRDYYGIRDPEIEDTLGELMIEFAEPSRDEYRPTEKMIVAAKQFSSSGRLNLSLVMETLNRGQIPSFIALFSCYSGVDVEHMLRSLRQPGGKNLAMICRACGLQKNEFTTIYLQTQRMRSADRIVQQQELVTALTHFDRIRPEMARSVLGVQQS